MFPITSQGMDPKVRGQLLVPFPGPQESIGEPGKLHVFVDTPAALAFLGLGADRKPKLPCPDRSTRR